MNTPDLAAALDSLAGNLEGHLYQRERDLVSDAAQRLRELEGVRVAAEEYHQSSHGGCDNPDVPLTCSQAPGEPLCPWCKFDAAMSAALARVGQ